MRGVHAGALQNAAVAEGLPAVLISINAIYKTRNAGIRITGIDAGGRRHSRAARP
jgi:predicted dinucleotide-binding enzyme